MLLDTSGLLCLQVASQPFHSRAKTCLQSAKSRLIHNYVFAEYVALSLARGIDRSKAIAFLDDLSRDPRLQVIWVDETLHRRAVALLLGRLDKTYSLCDAVSFVLMRDSSLSDALTTDRHFEQEGFNRLLK